MANNNSPTIIPNSIRSSSKEFPYIGESKDVYDSVLEKNQESVNKDMHDAIGDEEHPNSILGKIKKINDSVSQPNGIASLDEDGKVPSDQLNLISEEINDTALCLTQAQINNIALNNTVTVDLTATPDVVFVGQETTIDFVASASISADNLKIMLGDVEVASDAGISVSGSYNVAPNEAGNILSIAECAIGTFVKSTSKIISAVYPIKYGAGMSYTDATTQASARKNPTGIYNIVVSENDKYVFFVVPGTMSVNGAKMGGFDFPLEAPVNVNIDNVEYKYYQSCNTYDAGTLTIEIL